jgi:fumarate reductase subunit C
LFRPCLYCHWNSNSVFGSFVDYLEDGVCVHVVWLCFRRQSCFKALDFNPDVGQAWMHRALHEPVKLLLWIVSLGRVAT